MITIELTDGWDGPATASTDIPNEDLICHAVRALVGGKVMIDPADHWTWTACKNGDEIIDFGSHTWFARVRGASFEPLKDVKAVLEEQKEKRK